MEGKPTFDEAWAITKRFYHSEARKWSKDPYVLDLMWDASVDALLNAWKLWDPARGLVFVEYLFHITKNGWRVANWHMLSLKRDRRKEVRSSLALVNVRSKDTGQDRVDGKDLWERVSEMSIPSKETSLTILHRYYSGETLREIATSRGVSRQAIEQRIYRIFRVIEQTFDIEGQQMWRIKNERSSRSVPVRGGPISTNDGNGTSGKSSLDGGYRQGLRRVARAKGKRARCPVSVSG